MAHNKPKVRVYRRPQKLVAFRANAAKPAYWGTPRANCFTQLAELLD